MNSNSIPPKRHRARRVCASVLALGAALLLSSALSSVQAATVTEVWAHRYGNTTSNANDRARKVVRDAAGDIIVVGVTDNRSTGGDMLILKYSGTDGSLLWQRRYNKRRGDGRFHESL